MQKEGTLKMNLKPIGGPMDDDKAVRVPHYPRQAHSVFLLLITSWYDIIIKITRYQQQQPALPADLRRTRSSISSNRHSASCGSAAENLEAEEFTCHFVVFLGFLFLFWLLFSLTLSIFFTGPIIEGKGG
jgi:hypothetical protein